MLQNERQNERYCDYFQNRSRDLQIRFRRRVKRTGTPILTSKNQTDNDTGV